MEFKIIRSFYSQAQANLYLIRLQKEGITCFLSNENISTILPLSDGGLMLNIAIDQMAEAFELLQVIDKEQQEFQKHQDFREATKEDIFYEKQVQEREKWLNGGWLTTNSLYIILGVALFLVILWIVINYFFPENL